MPSNALDALCVAPEIAPLSSGGDVARALHALARALASLGVNVTVVAPKREGQDPAALGLARWVEPFAMDTGGAPANVAVYEGALPSGGGRVLLIEGEHVTTPDLAVRAAVELSRRHGPWPDVVHATELTAGVIPLARERAGEGRPPPASVLTVLGTDPLPAGAARPEADRIVVPTREHAQALASGRAPVVIPPGIEEAIWDPSRDPHLEARFSASDPSGKAPCKLAIQRELGLAPGEKTPLIAALSPLEGTALSAETADALRQSEAQFAFVVDPERDDPRAQRAARDLAVRTPTRVALSETGDEGVIHRILGGADLALLLRHQLGPRPTSDLHVLAYGALPIAPRAGEYADRIVEVDRHSATGNGFLYRPAAGPELVAAVHRALAAFRDPELFCALVARALGADLSWKTSARRYLEIYREALAEQNRPREAS